MRAPILPSLLSASLLLGGCSLISADFDGQVEIEVEVNDEDSTYESIERVNPEDNEDYRKHKDKIDEGEIESLEITIIETGPACGDNGSAGCNGARLVVGQVDIQGANGDWITGIGNWDGVEINVGNSFTVVVPIDKQEEINALLKKGGEITLRIVGIADQGPVVMKLRIVVNLRFTASP